MSSDIVKQGYVKVESKHLGSWNKRWLKLRNVSKEMTKRLEKYSDEATANMGGGERATYDLNHVQYVSRIKDSKKKHAVQVVLEDFTNINFALDSEMEADNWLTAIKDVIAGGTGLSRKDMFEVYMLKSSSMDASGECWLQVTADCINLLDIINRQKVQLTWPLSTIRKYSTELDVLYIEVGRSSPTGAGTFMFRSIDVMEIFNSIQAATKALSKQKQQKLIDRPPPYEVSESMHQAASSTEPRPSFRQQQQMQEQDGDCLQPKQYYSETSQRINTWEQDENDDEYFSPPPRSSSSSNSRDDRVYNEAANDKTPQRATWKKDDNDDEYYAPTQPQPSSSTRVKQTPAATTDRVYNELAANDKTPQRATSWKKDDNDDEYYAPTSKSQQKRAETSRNASKMVTKERMS